MNRTIELLKLLQACESIDGRKKLQKIVHILHSLGHPFAFQYSFHHHGPFSAELKAEIDHLVAAEFISESEESAGEYQKYNYSLGRRADEVLQDAGSEPEWVTLARELAKRSANDLEALSTMIYLMDLGRDQAEVVPEFVQLKPKLSGLANSMAKEASRLKAEAARNRSWS